MKHLMALSVSVSLALATLGSSAQAEDLDFTLINSTKFVIVQLQISPVSTQNWEENILGRDVLLQGESVPISIADGLSGCKYDMLITFNDGSAIEESNYNFCELHSYEVTE